jgi:hypothetical protein
VILVPPGNPVSTYPLMELCDTVIIYGTKTGVELTSMGIPVIVAGEAWIRNKGITRDATSADDYIHMLDQLPTAARMNRDDIGRALRYAFHFFYRRMIPLACMVPAQGNPPFAVDSTGLELLRPGGDSGLDVVCDGILTGSPFIFRAEDGLQD